MRRTVLAVLALVAPLAAAQQTRPTTAPDDPATPRGALRTLNQAMRDGNVAAIRQLFLATTPSEARMVDADAAMAAALARLRTAAVEAYGPRGADLVTGDTDAGAADSSARIDSADVVVTGDVATVVYRDEKDSPFVLKRSGGQWKVPVTQLGKPLDPAALDERLADLVVQRKVVQELTDQIRQKKFATAEEARQAWRTRILQAATSQPTTRPVQQGP
ncbi:MAG TPA: hypothetical protein VK797_14065 [Tepidisphaeraceae bacterium]|nr:hypothetical protein [Tepidisphaeraceae bacterium]